MRIQILPSTIDENGRASKRQHLMSLVIDDRVAIDAGSLAFSCTDLQRSQIRDIILTHTHLDHIAGLPLFIDDLFSTLERPICVHATHEMIEILERNIFNWEVYPKFSELENEHGKVLEYREFEPGTELSLDGLNVKSVPVNHQVNACGYIVNDGKTSIAITGDTAETEGFWTECNSIPDLAGVFVECAFPNELGELARVSCHLTPKRLTAEVEKLTNENCKLYVINLKPMYRDTIIEQLASELPRAEIVDIGRVYDL